MRKNRRGNSLARRMIDYVGMVYWCLILSEKEVEALRVKDNKKKD